MSKKTGAMDLVNDLCMDRCSVSSSAYARFHSGLPPHIGMEQTILLPPVQGPGRKPLSIALALHFHHGAPASRLMPTPTPTILPALHAIVIQHNSFEEDLHGL